MGNPLYERFGGRQQPNIMHQLNDLRAHPAQMLKQFGYNVPDSLTGNPQQIIQHLVQTGQVPNNAQARAMQILSQLTGKK
jgi:hypothetical protein